MISGDDSARLLILTYHYVRDVGGPHPGIHPISSAGLHRQLSGLMSVLHPATPEEVHEFVRGRNPFSRDAFFATFDDGLVDHLDAATKVLAPLGLRSAFLVPTRPLVEGRSPAVHKLHWLRAHTAPDEFDRELRDHLPSEWRRHELSPEDHARAAKMHIHDAPAARALKFMLNFIIPYEVVDQTMSSMLEARSISETEFCERTFLRREDLRALHRAGHVIGAHGHAHVPLSSLTAEATQADLTLNSRTLEEAIGQRPTWISYPYGRADALPGDCRVVCNRYGFDLGMTLLPGWNSTGDDPYRLQRITPNELPMWISSRESASTPVDKVQR